MILGLYIGLFRHLPLPQALDMAASNGYQAVEICVSKNNGNVDLDWIIKGNNAKTIIQKARDLNLTISAISNHSEGQLVLGPHNSDTDCIFPGSAKQKIKYGIGRMKKTALAAAILDVPVVLGFVGCEDYSRWFPWPNPNGWEQMAGTFVERWSEILDTYREYGIKFAHECHPKQYAYNIETALETTRLLDGRKEWGFNFDPANLMLAGVDPVVFIQQLGERILHVHAKDGELVSHNYQKSGLLAHGPWDRIDRGFRFRIPGWGDIEWKKIITELVLVKYQGAITVEHEDPTMSRLDGIKKAYNYLNPLLISEPFEGRWW